MKLILPKPDLDSGLFQRIARHHPIPFSCIGNLGVSQILVSNPLASSGYIVDGYRIYDHTLFWEE